jgi:hypothetical protein
MIPTAEEFLKEYELGNTGKIDIEDAREAIIEFAKLHVEAALKAASENATTINKPKFKGDINYVVDGDSILNAYPLENIK